MLFFLLQYLVSYDNWELHILSILDFCDIDIDLRLLSIYTLQ
jgi:hypothetical protein